MRSIQIISSLHYNFFHLGKWAKDVALLSETTIRLKANK